MPDADITRAKDGKVALGAAIKELCEEFEANNPDFTVDGLSMNRSYTDGKKAIKSITVYVAIKE